MVWSRLCSVSLGDLCSIWGRKSPLTQNSINFSWNKSCNLTFAMDRSASQSVSLNQTDDLCGFDKTQVGLLAEQCIVVNERDEVIGGASKKECHLWEKISTTNLLHRAFSVLLFNSKNELLIQQRSEAKITYPYHFTNTCCSHPLNVRTELISEEAVGVKTAAQRRLGYELGIPSEQVPPESMTLMTRIHYMAQNFPDTRWGEHEIDYILIVKKDVDLDVNKNEVREVRYVSQSDLRSMLAESRLPSGDAVDVGDLIVTPWFRLLCERDGGPLFKWWDNLENLSPLVDNSIHNWT